VAACAASPFTDDERRRILQMSPLGPPPADPSNAVADEPGAAVLGQALFFEPRLSGSDVACSTCHIPHHGFTDGKPVSQGVGRGRRHTASLWNVAYARWYFWDGRADSLWSQALVPLESATEMNGDRLHVAHLVGDDPGLRAAYEPVFGALPDLSDATRFPAAGRPTPAGGDDARGAAWAGMSAADRAAIDTVFANVGKAIAAYERRLTSRRSALDRYVEALRAGREDAAYGEAARRGLRLFIGRGGCRTCHSGPNLTDGEFHDTGLPPSRAGLAPDAGRFAGIATLLASPFNLLGRHSDDRSEHAGEQVRILRRLPETWGQFKTPSLRNVAVTAPYMHQGQMATLRDVLAFYSTSAGSSAAAAGNGERILKPLHLTAAEIDDLAAFLESLTDESIDPALFRAPARD
jgi:cytochrome c peroxidase